MNIFIVAIGSAGDVHPFLGIGRTLRARGHAVTVCASPVFQGLVERCLLRFLPIGTAEEYHRAMNNPALWNPRTSFKTLWSVVSETIHPLFDLLTREADDDTVVLGSLWAFGARLAQEKSGLPLITAQVSPSTFLSARQPPVHKRFTLPTALPYGLKAGMLWAIERSMLDPVCAPTVNSVRRKLGLPPVHRILSHWMHSPRGVLGLFPDWFAPAQDDWPSPVTLTGFPLFDESDFHHSDPRLEDFLMRGTPPVVFTPGSTVLEGQDFFRTAVEALQKLGRRGIFLTGSPHKVPQLPPSILLRSYVPMSALLPRSAALVHHGGIGTTALALAAGVPQIATPFAHDQFDNSVRIERLGCGIRLDAPATAHQLVTSLRRLFEKPGYTLACRQYQGRVERGESACARAADVVEQARYAH